MPHLSGLVLKTRLLGKRLCFCTVTVTDCTSSTAVGADVDLLLEVSQATFKGHPFDARKFARSQRTTRHGKVWHDVEISTEGTFETESNAHGRLIFVVATILSLIVVHLHTSLSHCESLLSLTGYCCSSGAAPRPRGRGRAA